LFRLWFALGYWADKPLTHDAQEYLELAKNFLQSGRLSYDVHHTTMIENPGRAPGYPVYLAFVWKAGPNLSWIRLCETVVSLFSIYLLCAITRELFHLRAAITAFLLSAFFLR